MRRLGVVCALAAVATAGRLAFLWAPNVSPVYAVAFLAGAAYGWRAGASVAVLAMVASDLLISGPNLLVMAVNAPAMALVGAAGALLPRGLFIEVRTRTLGAAVAGFLGIALTFGFSLASDGVDYALRVGLGEGVWSLRAYAALALAGLAFNVLPAVVNGALFFGATGPTLRALAAAGLLPARRGARPSPPASPSAASPRADRAQGPPERPPAPPTT